MNKLRILSYFKLTDSTSGELLALLYGTFDTDEQLDFLNDLREQYNADASMIASADYDKLIHPSMRFIKNQPEGMGGYIKVI